MATYERMRPTPGNPGWNRKPPWVFAPGQPNPYQMDRNLDFWLQHERGRLGANNAKIKRDIQRLEMIERWQNQIRHIGTKDPLLRNKLFQFYDKGLGGIENYEFGANERRRLDWAKKARNTRMDETGRTTDRDGNDVVMEPYPLDAFDKRATEWEIGNFYDPNRVEMNINPTDNPFLGRMIQ